MGGLRAGANGRLRAGPGVRAFSLLALAMAAVMTPGCARPTDVEPESARPAGAPSQSATEEPGMAVEATTMPDWAIGAVFYQIFPERFRNGDPGNDPTRESLEFPDNVSEKWRVTPWTSDWYARADWESERGPHFYDDGVFDRRYGGDLRGIFDKLDYLKNLGVDALYLNPVFYARSLHKYDGSTYHHIDPYFGPHPEEDLAQMAAETNDPGTWAWTSADRLFLKLLEEAHRRQMRVVIDGVFNHTGRGFFAFADILVNQQDSAYADWYLVQSFDNPDTPADEFRYKGWWGVATLPEFADNAARDNLHPGPKEYIFNATRRWMDPDGDGDPSDGVDGWRLDVAGEVPGGFWKEWHGVARGINPGVYTVAEHWHDAAQYIDQCGFSAVMNYHAFAFPAKAYVIDGTLSPTDAAGMLQERSEAFPAPNRHGMLSLIDSHDTDRLASMIVNRAADRPYLQPERFDYDVSQRASPRYWDAYDVRKPTAQERRIQRMAVVLQVTFVGAPCIYYGDEVGMWGADDPDDRMPMVWEDLEYEPQAADPRGRQRQPDRVTFNAKLHSFYQSALWLRRQMETLRAGAFEVVHTDDKSKVLAFRRVGEDRDVYVVFNRGEASYVLDVPLPGGGEVFESFTASGEPDHVNVELKSGRLSVALPGLEAVVVLHKRSD